jgi:hypothetical protein
MPHDYFRYTSSGVIHLLENSGFRDIRIRPWGHDRLTLASWGANYCLLKDKSIVHRAFNKFLVAGWTGLKAYYLHHPQPSPDLPFGWIAEGRK